MIFFVEISMIANCVLRLFDVNDFLKILAIFKPRSFELTKRCLKRKALNFLNLDDVAFVNDEKLNSKSRSRILEIK